MNGEAILPLICVIFTFGFFGWALWLTNPKHPERLQKFSDRFHGKTPKDERKKILGRCRNYLGDFRFVGCGLYNLYNFQYLDKKITSTFGSPCGLLLLLTFMLILLHF